MTALTAAQVALIADQEFRMADFGNFVESTLPDRERIGPTEKVLVALAQSLTAAEQQVAELRRRIAGFESEADRLTEQAAEAEAARDAAREETARVRGALARARKAVDDAARIRVAGATEMGQYARLMDAMAILDAALTTTPPQPAARTEEG